MEETLSVFNIDYDWASHRRRRKFTFKLEDSSVKSMHTSQLLFRCPLPNNLVEQVRLGASVYSNNTAKLFVDVIPIRTPPRYGLSNAFLQPHYNESLPKDLRDRFDARKEWGDNHVLPRIEDSGRYENIPICKPSHQNQQFNSLTERQVTVNSEITNSGDAKSYLPPQRKKKHRLAACIWASARYPTRGNRYIVKDGQRRLMEWIQLHQLVGLEHLFVYDNSLAYAPNNNGVNETTLKPVTDLFSTDLVTYVAWPFRDCNHNPNNVDCPGEGSSQYSAAASCRLRFGSQTDWLANLDIDEFILPMGNYSTMLPLLDQFEKDGKQIVAYGSWRNFPRRDFLVDPVPIADVTQCSSKDKCFELDIEPTRSVLQAYNCFRRKPGQPMKMVMPAQKQLYRPSYVKHQTLHYSIVTVLSELSQSEFIAAGYDWDNTRVFPDPNSHWADNDEEATMLHAKAIARQDTAGWLDACMEKSSCMQICRIGVPFPVSNSGEEDGQGTVDYKGWAYNCYVSQKVDDYWVPLLEEALNKTMLKLDLLSDE